MRKCRTLGGNGRISGELGWIVLGQGLVAAGALAGVRVLTELLPPASYGRLMLTLTLVTLVQQVTFGPLAMGFSRYFSIAVERHDLPGYYGACRLLALAAYAATSVLAGALWWFIAGRGAASWLSMGLLAFLIALATGGTILLDGIQTAARQRAIVALHQGVAQWLRFALAALIILSQVATTEAALSGYLLAAVAVLVSQYRFLRIRPPGGERGFQTAAAGRNDWLSAIFGYVWPFAVWGSVVGLQGASARWALEFYASTQEVGRYAVLFLIGFYPMQMLSGIGVQLLAPLIFARYGDGRTLERVRRSLHLLDKIIITVSLSATAGVLAALLFNTAIFRLLVGPPFRDAAGYLPVLVADSGLFAIAQLFALGAMTMQRSDLLLYPKILAAALGILGSLTGAWVWGLPGVVISSLMTQMVLVYWLAAIYARCKHGGGGGPDRPRKAQ